MPMALEPPPTHATTASGRVPVARSNWLLASSPITRWNSATSVGNGCGPTTDPMT